MATVNQATELFKEVVASGAVTAPTFPFVVDIRVKKETKQLLLTPVPEEESPLHPAALPSSSRDSSPEPMGVPMSRPWWEIPEDEDPSPGSPSGGARVPDGVGTPKASPVRPSPKRCPSPGFSDESPESRKLRKKIE